MDNEKPDVPGHDPGINSGEDAAPKIDTPAGPDSADPDPDEILLHPITRTGRSFYITVAILGFLVAQALFTYFFFQWRYGLGVTGLNRPIFWGVYITNFVFFIGISHAGTLISAILRIMGAEWRRPITRCAEVITVLVLFFGVANILLDLGRPDRALFVITHARFVSPLLWDVCSISAYLTASSVYLYVPLIPDIAILRDRIPRMRWFYGPLSLGYTGTPRQHHMLERIIAVMAVIVIPIAVSVHTVVSWVFAMTIQPMWHSAIFGPYFVVGAIFSGIAALIISMAIIRKVYRLEDYIKPIHFDLLGQLFLVMAILWFYFTLGEYLTTFYGAEPTHMAVFWTKISGRYWPQFWGMVVSCFVIPFAILAYWRTRTIKGTVIASVFVLIGMWLERYVIVVPTLMNPRLPYERGAYVPTLAEISLTVGCFAMFTLLYVLFTKFFPIISIWEIKEGRERAIPETVKELLKYAPSRGPRPTTVAILAIVLLGAALIMPGRAFAAPPVDPSKGLLRGMQLFEQKGCMRCHALLGEGGRMGPDLARAAAGKSFLDLAAEFWNHSPKMMESMKQRGLERPNFSADEIRDLFGFLHYLNYIDIRGDYSRGREVIARKNCLACHSVGKIGGKGGPRLDKVGRLSSVAVAQAMWNHVPVMQAAMVAQRIEVPNFAGDEFVDLMAFLRGESNEPGLTVYATPGDPARGERLFKEKGCMRCHSVSGKGGGNGPDLGQMELVFSATRIAGEMWNHSAQMLQAARSQGVQMPGFSGNEMADLLSYLYSLHFLDPPGDRLRGKLAYEKKGCAGCHTSGTAPDLRKSAVLSSPPAMSASMWNHAGAMARQTESANLPWPRLNGQILRDIVAYLHSSPGKSTGK